MIRPILSLLGIALLLAGCATSGPRNPVPQALVEAAQLNGMRDVRMWGDGALPNVDQFIVRKISQMKRARPEIINAGAYINVLALSGGADDGAFGAGLLAGWSASKGGRPQFDLVSGVSTGALIAPFVFLGPRYDPVLEEIYTQYSTEDLVIKQPLSGLVGGIALADATPLENLIAHYVDAGLLRKIAREYKKGRVLLISTTNLDAQRPVIWNMGAIAAHGGKRGLDLFRKVVRAAVAIPGAFPPVHIKVHADGKLYEEMHVDGGATSEVFLLPSRLMFHSIDSYFAKPPRRRMFIIMNNRLSPEWKPIEASLLPISARSLSTVLKNQSIGDLAKLYVMAQRDHLEYNLASLPDNFQMKKKELFDKTYMTALYKYAYHLGQRGYHWASTPPGLETR